MYSHHTRIYPKRDDVYRAEFSGPYYSTSSVYSYSPTSTSDCPEHGRSPKRITVILTTSVILATLGVLSIAGVAAYLGILSKTVNNASESAEGYLFGDTDNRGGGLDVPTTTPPEDNAEYIFTTNDDLLGGLDALDGVSGDNLISGDLTRNRVLSSTSTQSPARVIEGHRYTSHEVDTRNPVVTNDLHIISQPMNKITVRPTHEDMSSYMYPHEAHSVRTFTEPSQTNTKPTVRPNHRQKVTSTASPRTSSIDSTTVDNDSSEIIQLGEKYTNNLMVQSVGSEGKNKAPLNLEFANNVTITRASSEPKAVLTRQQDETISDHHESTQSVDPSREEDGDQKGRSDEIGDDRDSDHGNDDESHEDDKSTDYDESRLAHVNPIVKANIEQLKKSEVPFKTIMHGMSSESSEKDGNIKFDKVSPEYYDNQPWTPLLNRPNLDKRPRVDVDLRETVRDTEETGVEDAPMFSSTEPIIIWNSEEPVADILSSSQRRDEYNPMHHDRHDNPGLNFTVSTYYGYGHESTPGSKEKPKPGTVSDEPLIHYSMDNPEFQEETNQNKQPSPVPETSMNGFRPVNMPAYTVIIPHIPNPNKTLASSSLTFERDVVGSEFSHSNKNPSPEENVPQYSSVNRMGTVAEESGENERNRFSSKYEPIKTIPVPEDYVKSEVDDYLEEDEIEELVESSKGGETKVYRLDPDSVKDLVPDSFAAGVSFRQPVLSSTVSSLISSEVNEEEETTTNDMEDVSPGPDRSNYFKRRPSIGEIRNQANNPNEPISSSTKDPFERDFSPTSMELVIGPKEPDMHIKSTTDLIMSTLGSLNLIKTPAKPLTPTVEEINDKLKSSDLPSKETLDGANKSNSSSSQEPNSDEGDPLFPPVRSYVGVNQPLRPKPSDIDILSSNHINKQLRMSEYGSGNMTSLLPDLPTTNSLQKVLSMMFGTHDSSNGSSRKLYEHPIIKSLLERNNVSIVVSNDTGSDTIISLSTPVTSKPDPSSTEGPDGVSSTPRISTASHRDAKSFGASTSDHRESKIDHAQFASIGDINHIPVPLISITQSPPVQEPPKPQVPEHLQAFPWSNRPPKLPSKVNRSNSPVYKFVLKKGQSIEDLLKDIFSNYTSGSSSEPVRGNDSNTKEVMLNQVPVKLEMASSLSNPINPGHQQYLKSLEVDSSLAPNSFDQYSTLVTSISEIKSEATTISYGGYDVSMEDSQYNGNKCNGNDTFTCVTSGKCIPSYLRCNFIKECEDNSDEAGCLCADFLRANGNSRKLCDGIPDCADASDEYQNCEYCQPGQYICAGTRSCINKEKVCDNRRDCQYGDDESDCVKIGGVKNVENERNETLKEEFSPTYHREGPLMVRKRGVWGKLCVESFNSIVSHWEVKDLARAVCKALTYSDYEKVEKIEDPNPDPSEPYYELHNGANKDDNHGNETHPASGELHQRPSGLGFRKTECETKLVVNVTCKNLLCGMAPRAYTQRARYRVTRIVGGANSLPGKWPWQAALYKNGEYQCGATLISSRWLLSAGHCFYHAQDDYWVARLGTLRRGATVLSPYEQVVRITHIFLHPEYKDVGFINDVSLLRLEKEVNFTDFVRPVCLPEKESRIRDGRMCTVVGWGQLFEVGRVFPDTLQEVQLPLISTQECRKRTLFLPLYKLTDQMFCAGFDRGGRDACLGDSGGPLMCPESDGRWSLYGVTSNGYGCARANRPGVYTKVTSYLDWIYEKISQDSAFTYRDKSKPCSGHRCLLGECLERRQVCNGIRDCIEDDGSDETANCTTYSP